MAHVDDHASPTSLPDGHAHESVLPYPEICVICLDRVSEKAIAQPCKHDHFDLGCLGTWLQNQNVCPLCKSTVRAIECYDSRIGAAQVIQISAGEIPKTSEQLIRHRRSRQVNSRQRRCDAVSLEFDQKREEALAIRRNVYKNRLYSLYIGANRLNGYRNLTPQSFANNDHLTSKARRWIRRELAVFDFLNPDSNMFGRTDRRASNAEFLLEYVIAILKTMDIKGSAGQAEELLTEFLGRENTRLFLHELETWLRSPYEHLEDWDSIVQYESTFPSSQP